MVNVDGVIVPVLGDGGNTNSVWVADGVVPYGNDAV